MTQSRAAVVREARPADAAAIAAIHNSQGIAGTASYDTRPGTASGRLAWMERRRGAGLPVLVAVRDDEVLGFASYGPFRPEAGYDLTVEHSVYVAAGSHRTGIGLFLMAELLSRAREQRLHAVVGVIDAANTASLAFHERLGFVNQGVLHQVGNKFGRWLDVAFLVKLLDGQPRPEAGGGPAQRPAGSAPRKASAASSAAWSPSTPSS